MIYFLVQDLICHRSVYDRDSSKSNWKVPLTSVFSFVWLFIILLKWNIIIVCLCVLYLVYFLRRNQTRQCLLEVPFVEIGLRVSLFCYIIQTHFISHSSLVSYGSFPVRNTVCGFRPFSNPSTSWLPFYQTELTLFDLPHVVFWINRSIRGSLVLLKTLGTFLYT